MIIVILRIEPANCRMLLADCDLIVEGFDQAAAKKMLLEALGSDRLVVSASGIAGSVLNGIGSRRLGRCLIVGDFATDCADAPLYAHKVGTVANHMSAFILHTHGEQHGTHPQ